MFSNKNGGLLATLPDLAWGLVAVLAAGLLAVTIVRYLPRGLRLMRAGAFERYVLKASWKAKREWKHLAIALGLSYTDPRTVGKTDTQGRALKPQQRFPLIKVMPQPYGLLARVATIPKVGLKQLDAASQHIADAWGCETVEVKQLDPKWVELKGLMRDPLSEAFAANYTLDAHWRLYLGKDPWGNDLWIPLKELSGIKMAGMPGYGKTMLLSGWAAKLSQSSLVQFVIFDGKTRDPQYGDWGYFANRAVILVGDNPEDANKALTKVVEYIKTRQESLHAERGTHKFWKHGPSLINPLMLVILDECHNYTDSAGLRGGPKELIEANQRLCRTLAKEGRGLGVIGIFATQKQTGDAIPTAVRDLLEVGVSFATATMDGAEAALGSGIRKDEANDPTAMIDKERFVGIAVAGGVPGRRGYTRFRTETHDEDDLIDLVFLSSHLRRDVFNPGGLHQVTDRDQRAG